ncbi:extracellular catalytic domain type 1 short-chain-length polyhydroxyalkanoate depolymerase [Streptomyces sp. WMMC897]|uniref:extracellular catalytic domain type 1 short-chain-length polyhydroxyalkanoate depolymerase n=1 Tax=Streptomyces sp. WMMC897 TaxID=3014782 RepID=UPI0022B6BAAC|nr:PHB depolymerase family esterase [Streptomyces sp. WMMC897]MCZ7415001.1 PHB depolymerase family esterase [Streptomyces sp. WMMC897]
MRSPQRLRRAAAALTALALPLLALTGLSPTAAHAAPPAPAGSSTSLPGDVAATSALERITGFGSNPGALTMYRHLPDGLASGSPVVLVLHGCTQDAAGYVAGSGWAEYADARGFALVAAQQETVNNSSRCFNWFEPGDTSRGRGEVLSLRQMVAHTVDAAGADPSRVFVAGFSAGGAMASSVLAAYPDVFAGGAVLAGVPHGCATNMVEAFGCMNPGETRSADAWGDLVRAENPGYTGPWPTVSVWHGTSDTTVRPVNATESVKQWTDVHGTDASPDSSTSLPGGVTRTTYDGPSGTVVHRYTATGMGHAVPVRPAEGCGASGSYFADVLCSTSAITTDWGLGTTEPGDPGDPGDPDPGDPTCVTASNYAHTTAGRAVVSYGYTYAVGSGDALGLWNTYTHTSLAETSPGWYERVASC